MAAVGPATADGALGLDAVEEGVVCGGEVGCLGTVAGVGDSGSLLSACQRCSESVPSKVSVSYSAPSRSAI